MAETAKIIIEADDRASKTIGGIGDALGGLAKIAGGAALAGIGAAAAGLAASVNAAADFETTLNRFSAVTGIAGEDLKQFNDLALQLGADTQFSAGQAADAMVELAKGGIDPATIAAGTLNDTLGLAAAGELELATSAEIMAKQLGVWATEADKANGSAVTSAQVADLLAQAANASTVNVDDLALGLANVGGVAKVAGLKFDETTQAMALLAPGFSSAADAGTSFKAFLNNMVPTSKNAKTAMWELGLMTMDTAGAVKFLNEHGIDATNFDTAQIEAAIGKVGEKAGMSKTEIGKLVASFDKSAFYDAAGNFVGMEEAARLLHDATKDLTQEQKSLALETIFGSDAQRAAAILAEAGAAGFDKMGESMKNAGTAAEQADARNRGFNFAMESLKGSIETVMIVIGQKLLPVATEFINTFLIPAVNGIGNFMSVLEPMIAFIGGPSATSMTTFKDALLETFGAKQGDEIFKFITGVMTALAPMIETAKQVAQAFIDNWPQIQATVSTVIGTIVEFISTNLPPIVEIARGIFEGVLGVVQSVFGAVGAFIANHGEEIKTILATAWEVVQMAVQTAMTFLQTVVVPALQGIAKFISDHGSEIQAIFSTVWGVVKTVVGGAVDLIKGLLASAMQLMQGDVKGALNTIKATFETVFGEVIEFVKGLPAKFVEFGRQMIQGMIDGLGQMKDALLKKLKEIIPEPIRKFLGIESPSKLFMYYGRMSAAGYIKGFERMMGSAELGTGALQYAGIPTTGQGMSAGSTVGAVNVTINMSGGEFNGDINYLARQVARKIREAI